MVERGIILAGGSGSRMQGLTEGGNKHALEVAGKPMLEYPLQTLQDMGIEKVTVVSSARGISELSAVVQPDFDIEFRLQPEALGMADALGHAAVKEEMFVVLCGDCYYDPTPELDGNVQLWWAEVEFAKNHGVWNPETNRIIEKPVIDIGRRAVIGAYVYDQAVFDFIRTLTPSARGELEITDINNWYLSNMLEMSYYGGFFGDMGTPEGLKRVEDYVSRTSA